MRIYIYIYTCIYIYIYRYFDGEVIISPADINVTNKFAICRNANLFHKPTTMFEQHETPSSPTFLQMTLVVSGNSYVLHFCKDVSIHFLHPRGAEVQGRAARREGCGQEMSLGGFGRVGATAEELNAYRQPEHTLLVLYNYRHRFDGLYASTAVHATNIFYTSCSWKADP